MKHKECELDYMSMYVADAFFEIMELPEEECPHSLTVFDEEIGGELYFRVELDGKVFLMPRDQDYMPCEHELSSVRLSHHQPTLRLV